MTRLFTYVVVSDHGFAPNPFHGICTLATCKPRIRLSAQTGDWVFGSSSRAGGGPGHAVFAMRVDKTMCFEEYWRDPRFEDKRPNWQGISLKGRCGDNIYHRDPATGEWQQEPSFHGPEDTGRDTSVDRVLVGEDFIYWGGDGPPLPLFAGVDVRTKGIGHRCRFPKEIVQGFVRWVRSLGESGVVGRPGGWPERVQPARAIVKGEKCQRSHRPCSGQRRVNLSRTGKQGSLERFSTTRGNCQVQ